MKFFDWDKASIKAKEAAFLRPSLTSTMDVRSKVNNIFGQIKKGGDEALSRLTSQFDGVNLTSPLVEIAQLPNPTLLDEDKEAILQAINNIKSFHEAQIPTGIKLETQKGVICEKVWRPIEKVGLYIPGGSAPLISTLLMLAIPAQIAGCQNIQLITPPQKGTDLIDPNIVFAAKYLGFKQIYLGGGAQAIAALTFGTETIMPVDKIFGPGNIWVTEAKKLAVSLPQGPAIDMPAGPSEVMVIADNNANANVVASDLIAQAEHDPLAQAILVSSSREVLENVGAEIITQLETLPRKDIAQKSLENAHFICIENEYQAIEIINKYAPEHLILNLRSTEKLLPKIMNAGSIFVGPYTAESAGDYASGTNHVLPTSGYAKNHSGLGTDAFMKSMTIQTMTKEGLNDLGPKIERLARLEGLEGHARAITIRRESLNQ